MHASPDNGSERMGIILAEFLKTTELKHLSRGLVTEILSTWAGDKRFKKGLADFLNRRVDSLLSSKASADEDVNLNTLLEDPAFLVLLSGQIPLLVQGASGILATFVEQLHAQPLEVKTGLIEEIRKNISSEQTGSLLNSGIRLLQSLQTADNALLANLVETLLCGWIAKVDFAELKELLETSEEGFLNVIKVANNTLWKYPAKLVILLSFFPSGINILCKSLTEILSRFNQAPPDLIADILLSLAKDLDPESISQTLNEGAELIRKITTGSALVGDPGTSRLEDDIANLILSVLDGLDGEVAIKARLALFRNGQKIRSRVNAALFADPKRLQRKIASQTGVRNSLLHSLVHKLSLLEDLSAEDFNHLLQMTLGDLDNQEISEAIELSVGLLERVVTEQSGSLEPFIDQILQQVDLSMLPEAFSSVGDNLSDSLKPLGRAVVPKLVTGICDILAPADDEFEAQAAEARAALRSLLSAEEVQA